MCDKTHDTQDCLTLVFLLSLECLAVQAFQASTSQLRCLLALTKGCLVKTKGLVNALRSYVVIANARLVSTLKVLLFLLSTQAFDFAPVNNGLFNGNFDCSKWPLFLPAIAPKSVTIEVK